MLTVQEINTEKEFMALQNEWNELLRNSNNDSIFLRHEWFRFCLKGLGKDTKPFFLIVRDGRVLFAVAPFMKFIDNIRKFPIKRIGFIEVPDTFIADLIVREKKNEIVGLLLDYLVKHKKGWNILSLNKIPKGSDTLEVLKQILIKKSFKFSIGVSNRNLFIHTNKPWENFWDGKSRKFRGTHKNIINKIKRLENVTVEEYTYSNLPEEIFNELVKLSQRSWKSSIGVAISSHEETKRSFSELTGAAKENGWLSLWFMRKNGVPIAMEYQLKYNNRVYALRSDFDQDYYHLSPGAYLNFYIIKHLFENDCIEYDMGPGTNDYKKRWTDDFHETISVEIFNKHFYPIFLFYFEYKLIPTLKQIKFIGRMKDRFKLS